MLDGLEGVMNLAAASGESLGTTSDIVTDALTEFGLVAKDSGHFADVLAAASSNANTNVSMMGETFKYCAPVAGSLGFSVEDTAEAIGLMANAGIKGSQAGTTLRTIMANLSGDVKVCGENIGEVTIATTRADGSMRDLSEILADCRVAFSGLSESEKAAAAEALVGKNAMSGFLALMNAGEGDIRKLSGAINSCEGSAKKMADTMNDNLEGQLTILKSALQELAISIGELLIPALKDIVQWMNGVVGFLNSLPEGVKKVVVVISLVLAVLGPLLIIIGKVVSAVGTIMTLVPKMAAAFNAAKGAFAAFSAVLAANPIMLVIAAVTALVAAFIYLWNTSEKFRQFWVSLWGNMKEIAVAAAKAIGEVLKNAWEGIRNVTLVIWNGISGFLSTVWNGIRTVIVTAVNGISAFLEASWNAVRSVTVSVWIAMRAAVAVAAGQIRNTVVNAWNHVKSSVSSVLSAMKAAVNSAFSSMLSGIRSVMPGVYSAVKSGFDNAVSYIRGLASNAFGWGADIIHGIVRGIQSAVGSVAGVASTIRSYLHFSVPDVGPLTDFESWMPGFMKGLAEGIENSKGMVKAAVRGLAADMVVHPQMKMDQLAVAGGGTVNSTDLSSLVGLIREAVGGATQSSGDIVIPVYLGGTMLDEVIVNAQQRANLRSGGR